MVATVYMRHDLQYTAAMSTVFTKYRALYNLKHAHNDVPICTYQLQNAQKESSGTTAV